MIFIEALIDMAFTIREFLGLFFLSASPSVSNESAPRPAGVE